MPKTQRKSGSIQNRTKRRGRSRRKNGESKITWRQAMAHLENEWTLGSSNSNGWGVVLERYMDLIVVDLECWSKDVLFYFVAMRAVEDF